MTGFKQNTEKLRRQLEKGDIHTICQDAHCAINTLYSAWRKSDATELTSTEEKAYNAFIALVTSRIEQRVEISQRAEKIAQRL